MASEVQCVEQERQSQTQSAGVLEILRQKAGGDKISSIRWIIDLNVTGEVEKPQN